ncbi:phosphonate ABC transporter substrate-binding protein [Mastigocoleus testarum]|uniref:Phosphonate ABC transporter substrate-binding protein n=1 Tax=Mastigocoleus testarum BC008 TaxID=371196 RepID=A0A0V7ZTP5_9CYAN|nr:phosphonate ABC transporter substrate-binding protein [Mastigocoleus testarum]KST67503.1 phosphonate ABC transporter substrate-binding protein [Mastigocoleus testarum BC008]
MYRRKLLTALLILLPVLGACNRISSKNTKGSYNQSFSTESKKEIVMGLIPIENNEETIEKFEPMRVFLEKRLERPVKVFTATDYAGVIEAMKRDKVDIAWFGPLSYVLAEKEADAEAFAVGVRKSTGLSTYKSIFVVPGNSKVKSIQDLKGKSVAFVDPASTSGSLVPTYLVKKATGKMPQEFFSNLSYAGGHDAAELAVKNKTVDAAADNDITYNKMLQKGLISKETNRILLESEPLPGLPLTYRRELDESLKAKIRDSILNAHKDIKVSGYGELERYDPVDPQDYQLIRDMVKELGLGRDEILK